MKTQTVIRYTFQFRNFDLMHKMIHDLSFNVTTEFIKQYKLTCNINVLGGYYDLFIYCPTIKSSKEITLIINNLLDIYRKEGI